MTPFSLKCDFRYLYTEQILKDSIVPLDTFTMTQLELFDWLTDWLCLTAWLPVCLSDHLTVSNCPQCPSDTSNEGLLICSDSNPNCLYVWSLVSVCLSVLAGHEAVWHVPGVDWWLRSLHLQWWECFTRLTQTWHKMIPDHQAESLVTARHIKVCWS